MSSFSPSFASVQRRSQTRDIFHVGKCSLAAAVALADGENVDQIADQSLQRSHIDTNRVSRTTARTIAGHIAPQARIPFEKHFHRLVWVSFIADPNRARRLTELSIKQFRAFDRRAAFFKRSAHEKHFSTLTAVPGSVFDRNHRVSSVGLSNTHIRRAVLSLFVSCASRKCSRSVGCIIRFNNNIHENSFENVGYGETRREGVMRKRVIRSEILVRKALTG